MCPIMGYEYHFLAIVTKKQISDQFTETISETITKLIMEYSTGELQCLNLDSTDLDHLASLADSYFSNHETEEEAFASASDISSDDEHANEGDNFDYKRDEDTEQMEVHMTERAKVQKFYAETCQCKLGLMRRPAVLPSRQTISLTLETTARNCHQRNLT